MKLLVFAHTPPPHHGQSYMVGLMLEGLGGNVRKTGAGTQGQDLGIQCYHVNARVSRDGEDIGGMRPGKLLRLIGHCLDALWCRFRYGVKTMYYVPAPGKPSAVYRDCLVMLLCRPLFSRIIFHWHAAGLANWLDSTARPPVRWLTRRLLRGANLSIVLSDFNRADAENFLPKAVAVVPVGIPDPCPDFETAILPRREARIAARLKLLSGAALSPAELDSRPDVVRVLYLAHGMREKGLFDTLEGVLLANQYLTQSPLRLHLTVVGAFFSDNERAAFQSRLETARAGETVRCLGFVSPEDKRRCLTEADLFCFPTYYSAENQPGNLIEAMAFGLPTLTTKWRSIPEMLPAGYPALVEPQSPKEIARVLRELLTANPCRALREQFLRRFTLEQHLRGMAAAIRRLE